MKSSRKSSIAMAMLATVFTAASSPAQVADAPDARIANIAVNYTEAKVNPYTLPDPLKMFNGQPVTDAKTWTEQRRPELLKYYQNEIYGRVPATAPKVTWELVSTDNNALEGTAVMKQLNGRLGGPDGPTFGLTVYTPKNATKPVPMLLGFGGGRGGAGRGRGPATGPATAPGPQARGPATAPAGPGRGGFAGPPRGGAAEMIPRGFGYAAMAHTMIETDQEGQANINIARKLSLAPGQTAPAPDEWGSIAVWAWGLSRVMDYLETDPAVDAKRVGIFGVSRLGKTVTWAGASDPRIALVIASAGGEGGAALARRNYGETVGHLVAPSRYPYQFAGNYAKYAADPNTLGVDTHCLVALVAPRPILLQTGTTDRWSDPTGEYLAAQAATPVYKLFGKKGVEAGPMPTAEMVGHDLAYFMHTGGHGPVPSDWDVFVKFMELHLKPGS